MVVDFLPQVGDDLLAHVGHEEGLSVIEEPFEDEDADDGQGDQLQHAQVFFEKDVIQDRFDQESGPGRGGGDKDHAGHGTGHVFPVGLDELQEAAI